MALLRWALIAAAALGLLLAGGPAAAASPAQPDQVIVKQGRITSDRPDWLYVPFEVPKGVREIHVSYSYERAGGNTLDIGVFDPDGYALGNAKGFRGWSGGARSEFTISRSGATPGYVPGAIDRGTWNLILGPYQVAPQGLDWEATITLRFGKPGPRFRPSPAPLHARGGPGWYRGDLHVHTVHSDGSYTPQQIVDGARAAGLDFVVSTDHNTPTASFVWGDHARPDLLVIDGEEITTRAGHYNALGLRTGQWIDWRYRPEDGQLPRFVREIHKVGGVAIANHPTCPLKGCRWEFGYSDFDAIEVWNGPWTILNELAVTAWDGLLRSGGRVPMAGGASDAHRPGQAIGLAQTVVRARSLSRTAILDGLREGHSYVTGSSGLDLRMTAAAGKRSALIGDHLAAAPAQPVTVKLRVRGATGAVAGFFTEDGPRFTAPLLDADETVSFTTTAAESRYVRAEVRRLDKVMLGLTNPIFLSERARP